MIIWDWFSAVIVLAVNAELAFSKLGQLILDVSRPTFRHSSFQKSRHLNVSSIVIYMVSDKSSIIEFMWCFWWSLGVALSVTLINNFCSISSGASFFKFFGVGRRKKAWSISNAEESGVLWGGHAKEFEKGCLYRKAARV